MDGGGGEGGKIGGNPAPVKRGKVRMEAARPAIVGYTEERHSSTSADW